MRELAWFLGVGALVALSVVRDLIFRGGGRCREFLDRADRDVP
jgi:hypothetical protein